MRLPFMAITATLFPLIRSFPDRAGTCVGGKAAVAGFHTSTDKSVKAGPISALFDVYLDGASISSDQLVSTRTGMDHELKIEITTSRRRLRYIGNPLDSSQMSFQGILIRAEASNGVDATDALLPGDNNLQREETCESPVAGICHVSGRGKTTSTATLRFDSPTTATFDITITTRNSVDHSVYYYSNYTIAFEQGNAVINDDAIMQPTIAPSLANKAGSDVPSVAPTFLDVMTAAPTSCSGVTEMLMECLQSELQDGDACDACVAGSLQNLTGTECNVYEPGACSAITTCPCGTCREELQHFINCAVTPTSGCPVSCSLDQPTLAPSLAVPTVTTLVPYPTAIVTDSPTSATVCIAAQDDLAQCFVNELTTVNAEECDRCVAAAISDTTAGCDAVENSICSAFETCPCGPCTDELTVFLNCQVGPATGCSFGDCPGLGVPTVAPVTSVAPIVATPTIAPTIATCNSAQTTLMQCFEKLSDSSACDSCVARVIPQTAPACDELQALVCATIDTCPCGECAADVENFLSCTFEPAFDCSFSCE